jgi:hypothetical protein
LYQTIVATPYETNYYYYCAGISGLSAGLHLHRKGFTVKIIEASDRVVAELKPI